MVFSLLDSMPRCFREQLNHHHPQHNQAHAEHGRDVELLPVDKQRCDTHHHNAHAPHTAEATPTGMVRTTRVSIQNAVA